MSGERPEAVDTSVTGIADLRWDVRPQLATARFAEPGWYYEEVAPRPCAECGGVLHTLRKPYESGGKQYRYVALVCPACPATFTLADLGVKTYEQLTKSPSSPRQWLDCDIAPGGVRVRAIPASQVPEFLAELCDQPGARVIAGNVAPPQPPAAVERRLLHWCKITDADAPVPAHPAGADVRVLLPLAPDFAGLCARLGAVGVPFRQVPYWWEAETISTVGPRGGLVPLQVRAELPAMTKPARNQNVPVLGWPAAAARDAFEMLWDVHAEPWDPDWEPVDAAHLVPEGWVRYLPYGALNPAQAHAVPVVLSTSGHVVVTAPTGAGKTVIGMLAALKAILGEHRKAAWLVPQRSLTDELDRDLTAWRQLGLRVERLSGEYVTDVQKAREADLWVATTEKFEAICRASSLRTALAEVACLVVDEIHLLGDPARGPLLEALLARMRGEDSSVRILGLSATVANADHIAEWLGAQLVHTAWRPSRLTWQLPMIPASSDRLADQANRTKMVTTITTAITQDGGSVLVFCGSKRNVRATALAIAAARGVDTRGINPDDLTRLHRACTAVGVGLHYKDWEHKREAERAFRARELEVLVATTTVAAGVNLPARAVVVRDTQIGLNEIDIATVQQMFGRAGRIGAGETAGWAYLITDATERPYWQARLVAGYAVSSHIADDLADHILAEAAQDRIHTLAEAESWWIRTLAYHQGTADLAPVHAAVEFLIHSGYLHPITGPDGVTVLTITELGMFTTRLMVPTAVGAALRAFLTDEPVPADPEHAEQLLGQAIATLVPQLAEAPVSEDLRPLVARLLGTQGHLDRLDDTPDPPDSAPAPTCEPGDLAQVAFALVANSPRVFSRSSRMIAGIPTTILYPILAEAPRYFDWLAAQGYLGTVHPWIAVVAHDLGRRIRWRRLAPTRGSGRLLWICEQMATRAHADTVVPDLFTAARQRCITAPDWPPGLPPRDCRLDQPDYLALLRDRATGTTFTEHGDHVTITCPHAAIATLWTDQDYWVTPHTTPGEFARPEVDNPQTHPQTRDATIFTRRGDHQSTGWLSTYNTIHEPVIDDTTA